jgi:hypothetical protein
VSYLGAIAAAGEHRAACAKAACAKFASMASKGKSKGTTEPTSALERHATRTTRRLTDLAILLMLGIFAASQDFPAVSF